MVTIGTPIKDYRDYLDRCIAAAKRAVDMTGYEHHKGALNAYESCLEALDEYPVRASDGQSRDRSGNHQ